MWRLASLLLCCSLIFTVSLTFSPSIQSSSSPYLLVYYCHVTVDVIITYWNWQMFFHPYTSEQMGF